MEITVFHQVQGLFDFLAKPLNQCLLQQWPYVDTIVLLHLAYSKKSAFCNQEEYCLGFSSFGRFSAGLCLWASHRALGHLIVLLSVKWATWIESWGSLWTTATVPSYSPHQTIVLLVEFYCHLGHLVFLGVLSSCNKMQVQAIPLPQS